MLPVHISFVDFKRPLVVLFFFVAIFVTSLFVLANKSQVSAHIYCYKYETQSNYGCVLNHWEYYGDTTVNEGCIPSPAQPTENINNNGYCYPNGWVGGSNYCSGGNVVNNRYICQGGSCVTNGPAEVHQSCPSGCSGASCLATPPPPGPTPPPPPPGPTPPPPPPPGGTCNGFASWSDCNGWCQGYGYAGCNSDCVGCYSSGGFPPPPPPPPPPNPPPPPPPPPPPATWFHTVWKIFNDANSNGTLDAGESFTNFNDSMATLTNPTGIGNLSVYNDGTTGETYDTKIGRSYTTTLTPGSGWVATAWSKPIADGVRQNNTAYEAPNYSATITSYSTSSPPIMIYLGIKQALPPTDLSVTKPEPCASGDYNVTFSWTGNANNWAVDVDDNGNWNDGNRAFKGVSSGNSTAAPAGFNNGLTLSPGHTYWWRIYYGVPGNWVYYTTGSGDSASGPGDAFSVPTCAVNLSGRVTNSLSGAGIGGVVINQGEAGCGVGTATTDAAGNWTIPNVAPGTGFCLRPPAVAGYGAANTTNAANPGSYECQTAGLFRDPDLCGQHRDMNVDNAYNFTYSPIVPPTNMIVTKPACADSTFKNANVVFNWTNSASSWWIDILSESGVGLAHKQVSGLGTDGSGFTRFSDGQPFDFVPGTTYHWQIWYGSGYAYPPNGVATPQLGTTFSVEKCLDLKAKFVKNDPERFFNVNEIATVIVRVTNIGGQASPATTVTLWRPTDPGFPTCTDVGIGAGTIPPDPRQTASVQGLSVGQSRDYTLQFNVGDIKGVGLIANAYVIPSCIPKDGDWTNNKTNANFTLDGPDPAGDDATDNLPTLPSGFTYNVNVKSWFETSKGDVGSSGNISISQRAPDPKFNSEYLIAGSSLSNTISKNNWTISNYGGHRLVPSGSVYNYLFERFKDKEKVNNCNISAGGIPKDVNWYQCSGDSTFSGGTSPNGTNIYFIDGNLTIEGDITSPASGVSIFIVKKSIKVNADVRKIDGIYVAGEQFSDTDPTTESDDQGIQLVINGAIYANSVLLSRYLGGSSCAAICDNTLYPSDVINFDLKYLVTLNGVIGSPSIVWTEVAP